MNGKGSKSRISNKKLFDVNFEEINWCNIKEENTKKNLTKNENKDINTNEIINKNMKNTIAALMTALVLSCFSVGAEEAVNEQLFNKNEVTLTLGGSYFTKDTDKWGGTVGLRTFPFQKYFGAEVSSTVRNLEGSTFENVRLEGVARLPLDKYRLAFSAVGGAQYRFEGERYTPTKDSYQFGLGGRVEYRFNPKWGAEAGYRYNFERQLQPARSEILFGINLSI